MYWQWPFCGMIWRVGRAFSVSVILGVDREDAGENLCIDNCHFSGIIMRFGRGSYIGIFSCWRWHRIDIILCFGYGNPLGIILRRQRYFPRRSPASTKSFRSVSSSHASVKKPFFFGIVIVFVRSGVCRQIQWCWRLRRLNFFFLRDFLWVPTLKWKLCRRRGSKEASRRLRLIKIVLNLIWRKIL